MNAASTSTPTSASTAAPARPVCPTEAIFYEDDVPEEWEDYTRANIDFFELKGLGSPGGAQRTGALDYDDPMIAALPPQNEEWKEANGY